jgi:hypothetical protein
MKRVNIFSPSVTDRILFRSVCYKGGDNEVPETAQEVELKRVAIERWNDHQNRLMPSENEYIEDVSRSPEAMKERAAGQVNADVAQGVGAALPSLQGVNPNSGKVVAAPTAALGQKLAKAQVTAAQNIEDTHAKGLQSVVNLGQGKASSAMTGFGAAATDATGKAITEAKNTEATNQALASAIASGVGTGAAIYGHFSNPSGFDPSQYQYNGGAGVEGLSLNGNNTFSFWNGPNPRLGPLR